MDLSKINSYFPIDFRGTGKGGACFYVYPEKAFSKEQLDDVDNETHKVWGMKKYFPMCMSIEIHPTRIVLYADYAYVERKYHKEIVEELIKVLNNVKGIRKVIINDGSPAAEDENAEQPGMEGFDLDSALGLDKLSLAYPVHADGIEGECFDYSIYFSDGNGDKERADAVAEAIHAFDFGLTGDAYTGYLDISPKNSHVSVCLDLGNVDPQNEGRILHGILLALNSVPGIEKVIINEDGSGEL